MPIRWIRSDVSWIVGLGLLTQVITIASGPLVARMLGPSGRGDMTMIMVITIIAAHLSSTSLSNAIATTVARRGRGAHDVMGDLVTRWGRWAVVPAAGAAAATALLLDSSPFRGLLMIEAFLVTFLACRLNLISGMLQGEHSARRTVQTRVVFSLTYVGGVVLLFAFGSVHVAAFVLPCQIAAQLVALVLNTRALQPATPGHVEPGVRTEVLTFARQAYVSSLGTTDMLGLDSLLVGLLLGNATLGLYAVALSTTTLPGIVVGGLATTLLARMSAREPIDAAALMRRWLLAGLAVGGAMVAGLEVVIGPALRILFGSAFVPATHAAQILALAAGISGMRFLLAAAAQAQGSATRASVIDLMSGPVLLATMALGAHLDGLDGAALGVALTGVFKCVGLSAIVSWTGRGVAVRPGRRADTSVPDAGAVDGDDPRRRADGA